MKKRCLLLSLCSLFVMAGCGETNNGEGSNSYVDTILPTDDPTSEVEIKFWHCLGHDKEENLNKIVNSFNTKYAGKYKVTLNKVAGDYDALNDAVKTKLASGEVPALTMGYPDSFASYMGSTLSDSNILRLNNFINDENYGYSQDELDDFVDEYLKEGNDYTFNGYWSMPMYKSTEVLYYNVNYFYGDNEQNDKLFASSSEYSSLKKKIASATPAQEDLDALKNFVTSHKGYTYDLPVTWDDMVSVSKKMIADRNSMNVTNEFYPLGYDSDANLFISQFAQRNIDYTTELSDTKEGHFLFNNDKAKALTQEIVDLVNDKVLITKGTLGGSKYTSTYFNEAKLAMSVGSTGGSSYQVSANFKVGLAAVPYKNQQKYIMQGPSICFFNNNNNYIHKGAWLFYKEMAAPEANCALALENSYDPIRKSSYETTQYKNWIALAGRGTLSYDIPAITSTLKDYYFTSPSFVGSGTARTEIGKLLQYTVNSKMSIDQAFETVYNACIMAA